jgi:hypothetical protein
MNSRQSRLILLGLALGILIVLSIAPQTCWLVRLQTLISFGQYHLVPKEEGSTVSQWLPEENDSYTRSTQEDNRRRQAVAAQHPEDYSLQYAAAKGRMNTETLVRLRALTTRFPGQPSLYANILRYELTGTVHLFRPENARLTGEDPQKVYHPTPATPEQLAAFDREAAAGERLDPANAYFPLMRAIGLFAASRDAEAVEAVRRASQKPLWQEYLSNDVQSRWRLHQEAFGDPGAISRAAIWADTLLPQYQGLRQAAIAATYQGMLAEQAGHPQDGLELREAVRRCGDKMRVQSLVLIGSLVGAALGTISCQRPGGAPPVKNTEPLGNRKAVADAYAAYARRLGREDIAQATLAENAAGVRVQDVLDSVRQSNDPLQKVNQLDNWWVAGLLLLVNLFWTAMFWAVAFLWMRLRGTSTAPPDSLPWRALLRQTLAAVALGLWLFILAVCAKNAFEAIVFGGFDMAWRVGLTVLILSALVFEAGRRAWRRLSLIDKKGVLKTLGGLVLVGFGLYGVSALLHWQTHGIWETLVVRLFFTGENSSSDSSFSVLDVREWLSLGGVLLVPLLTVLTLAALAGVRRRPLVKTISQGFLAAAPPLIFVLFLAYSVVVLGTLRSETALSAHLQQIQKGGGSYVAAQAGLPWPGPVP